MGRRIGPDFSGIRDAMDRIDGIKRRISKQAPAPRRPQFFQSELDRAKDTQKKPEPSAESEKAKKPDLPSLTGKGSVVKSRASASRDYDKIIEDLAEKYGVDGKLVKSVISVESAWRPDAVSPKGALGLMQLMPGTAKMLGVNPKIPSENIEGGVKYLSKLSDKYNGDLERVLAAYNAGPGRVDAFGGIPPFKETEAYVKRVLRLYEG